MMVFWAGGVVLPVVSISFTKVFCFHCDPSFTCLPSPERVHSLAGVGGGVVRHLLSVY